MGTKVMSAAARWLLPCPPGRARRPHRIKGAESVQEALHSHHMLEPRLTGSPEAKADVMSTANNAVLGQAGLVDGSGSHEVHGILTCDGYGG